MLYSILIHVSSQNFFEIDLIFMHACPDLRAVDNRRFLQLFMIQNRLTLNSIACFQCKRVHYCMPDKVSYWYDVIWDSFIQYSWGLSSNMKTRIVRHSFSSSHSLSLRGCNMDFRCHQHIHVRKLDCHPARLQN